jgi:hypothetical protein
LKFGKRYGQSLEVVVVVVMLLLLLLTMKMTQWGRGLLDTA